MELRLISCGKVILDQRNGSRVGNASRNAMRQQMIAPVPQSLIDAAETYEGMFVPALFGQ
jgi:hypothetical protein